MKTSDEKHTSFITDTGLYCYKVMPFGLKNAGVTYQRLINKIFFDLLSRTMEVHLDNMLVKSLKIANHISHLEDAFIIMKKYCLKLNPLICAFGVTSGKFLGYIVNQHGIEENPKKVKALLNMRSPSKPKAV